MCTFRICRGDGVARRQESQLHPPAVHKGPAPTKSASGRSRMKAVKATLISRLLLALRAWICNPMARAAASTSLNAAAEDEPDGSVSTATRLAVGTSSRKSSSRFVPNSASENIDPGQVAARAGEAGDETNFTGSSAARKTMEIVVVVAFAANAEVGPPVAAITATCRRTKSAAIAGSR